VGQTSGGWTEGKNFLRNEGKPDAACCLKEEAKSHQEGFKKKRGSAEGL